MRKFLVILTLFMLTSVTLWNLFWALLAFVVVPINAYTLLIVLLFVLLLPFVLIRKLSLQKWTMSDVIIVWLSIAPGLYFVLMTRMNFSSGLRMLSRHLFTVQSSTVVIAYCLLGSLTTLLMYLDRSPRIPNSSGDVPKQ